MRRRVCSGLACQSHDVTPVVQPRSAPHDVSRCSALRYWLMVVDLRPSARSVSMTVSMSVVTISDSLLEPMMAAHLDTRAEAVSWIVVRPQIGSAPRSRSSRRVRGATRSRLSVLAKPSPASTFVVRSASMVFAEAMSEARLRRRRPATVTSTIHDPVGRPFFFSA